MTTRVLEGEGPSAGSPDPAPPPAVVDGTPEPPAGPVEESEDAVEDVGAARATATEATASATATATGGTSFELRGLVLLDPAGNYPVVVHALHFGNDGIGLVGREGSAPRLLPWTSVATHAVEPWTGGTIPEGWVDPARPKGSRPQEQGRGASGDGGPDPAVEPQGEAAVAGPGHRSEHAVQPPDNLPHVDAGALIDIQTASGTFRFLLPRADPRTLADRITAIAMRQRGVAGASSVTTALGAWRRRGRWRRAATRWERVQRVLVVVLVVVIAAAVTLILLQSAGAVHLPFIGGTGGTSAIGASG
jgi:hypothetical protein